jgi:hypothetical protein
MVTKREIYAIIAAYGLGRVLPSGSTTQAAKVTVRSIARPILTAGVGLARRHPGVAIGTGLVAAHELGYLDPIYERAKPVRKKAMSKFNQAIKKGMAILKASPSYGKKGVISNAKKALSAVSKTVSKVKHGKPKPKRGNAALKKVWTMAAKLVKPHVKSLGPLPRKPKAKRRKTRATRYAPTRPGGR